MNTIDRAGRFSLGLILGLLLIVLLVFLVLESWFLYKNGNTNTQIVQKDNVAKCCLVQAEQCCAEKKPVVKASQKKPKPKPQGGVKLPPKPAVVQKSMPQAVVVEEIIPQAVALEPSTNSIQQERQPGGSLLNGVDPDFGKASISPPSEEREKRVRRKVHYVVRQQPLYSAGGYGYSGCPYRYGCEYGNTYPQYVGTYAPQVTYGQPYIPPPQTVFIPAPPVIVPAPSVVTPAGMYGR